MNPQISELLDVLLQGPFLGVEEERHYLARAQLLGVEAWRAEQILEAALQTRGIVREGALLEDVERLIAPRVRDKFLDIEEEKYTLQTLCNKWSIDTGKALSLIRQTVERHGAVRAEDLREEFEGYLFSRLEHGSRIPRNAIDYLLQLAQHRNIDDDAGIEGLVDDICIQQGWIREDSTGTLAGATSTGSFPGASPQGYSTGSFQGGGPSGSFVGSQPSTSGSFGGYTNSGSFVGTTQLAEEQIQGARRLIMTRIGNDQYLDQAEENEYFAKAGDEWGLSYESALQILEQTLQQYNAVRERTAIEDLCKQLQPMLDDQYLDSAELQRAYLIGQDLGLDRSEDVELINKIIQRELAKQGALTELKAREWLREYIGRHANKKRISPDNLTQGVQSLLKEYRLAHKEETREQVMMLAKELAESGGFAIKSSSKAGPVFVVLVVSVLLAGGGFYLWKNRNKTTPPPNKLTNVKQSTKPDTSKSVKPVTTCALSPSVQSRMKDTLIRAQRAFRNRQFTTPVEDSVNLWTQAIINKVTALCPGTLLEKQPIAKQAQQLRWKSRDFYIARGRKAIRRNNTQSACRTWLARARIFGGGEELTELMKQHCKK